MSAQVLNIFPAPTGKSGIGPGTPPAPQNLLHIHGWNPNATSPFDQYVDPFLRISLESIAGYNYYGMIGLQNAIVDGINIIPQNLSLLSQTSVGNASNKYDFVITTSHLTDPVLPFNYDLILSAKNRKASIRFATTPRDAPPLMMNDVERMTIAPYGSIGMGTPFPFNADKLHIHYVDNPQSPFPEPFPAIKLSIHPDAPVDPFSDPNDMYYHSLNIALAPCDGCFTDQKYDAVITNTAGDLILKVDKAENDPKAFLNPNTSAGAIRFKTTPLASPRTRYERMTILGNGNVGIGTNDPRQIFHITEPSIQDDPNTPFLVEAPGNLLFGAGVWPHIKSNSVHNFVPDPQPGHYEDQRFRDGAAGGIVFPPGASNSPDNFGGVWLFAHKYGVKDEPFSDIGNNLNLTYRQFNIDNANGGVLFRVTAPISNQSSDAGTGWTYIKNRTLIGTEGENIAGNLNLNGIDHQESLMLAVNGMVLCKELLVRTSSPIPWPDYVFDAGYKPMPLDEVEKFVLANKHLPDVPSASEIEKAGVNVVEMQAKLLKKIEELTLYVIELKKENEVMKQQHYNLK